MWPGQHLVAYAPGPMQPIERSGASNSNSRPVPHCRVLLPGEFNDNIRTPFPMYSEFHNDSCNRFRVIFASYKDTYTGDHKQYLAGCRVGEVTKQRRELLA